MIDREENADRIDELEDDYNAIERVSSITRYLFWASAIMSLLMPYSSFTSGFISQAIIVLFLVLVILHFSLSKFNELQLIPAAEKKRRKQLLSNAFNVPLIPEHTVGYYNNPVPPSLKRLGVSILENAFFGRAICSTMLRTERIIILGYVVLWLMAIFFRATDLSLIVTLTQLLFSGQIFTQWLRLEFLVARLNNVYESLYALFLHQIAIDQLRGMAGILDHFAAYESAKASASIKQSKSVFEKLNRELTKKWEDICRKLAIAP
jgi:hypothetical protein